MTRTTNDEEIEEREKTIEKKMERINNLMRKKQELEKFKFVLEYKINELKKERGPSEEESMKMRIQLQNMRKEIGELTRALHPHQQLPEALRQRAQPEAAGHDQPDRRQSRGHSAEPGVHHQLREDDIGADSGAPGRLQGGLTRTSSGGW